MLYFVVCVWKIKLKKKYQDKNILSRLWFSCNLFISSTFFVVFYSFFFSKKFMLKVSLVCNLTKIRDHQTEIPIIPSVSPSSISDPDSWQAFCREGTSTKKIYCWDEQLLECLHAFLYPTIWHTWNYRPQASTSSGRLFPGEPKTVSHPLVPFLTTEFTACQATYNTTYLPKSVNTREKERLP